MIRNPSAMTDGSKRSDQRPLSTRSLECDVVVEDYGVAVAGDAPEGHVVRKKLELECSPFGLQVTPKV